jgi:hypothetical protein
MTAPKRRRRKEAPLPQETIAAIVVAADRESDDVVAKRMGVTRPSIKRWRHEATKDPELASAIKAERRRVLDEWRFEAAETAIAIAREVRRRIAEREEIPFALIGAAKAFTAANIEAGALLGPPEEEAEPELNRTPRMEARH